MYIVHQLHFIMEVLLCALLPYLLKHVCSCSVHGGCQRAPTHLHYSAPAPRWWLPQQRATKKLDDSLPMWAAGSTISAIFIPRSILNSACFFLHLIFCKLHLLKITHSTKYINPKGHGSLSCQLVPFRVKFSATHQFMLPVYTPVFFWSLLLLLTEGWPGWVGLGSWLHTKIVYPSVDGHLFKY